MAGEPSLAAVKAQCRIEPDDLSEDQSLTLYAAAAWDFAKRQCNADFVDFDTAPPAVQMGTLLLIGHWYLNREAVVIGAAVADLPLGAIDCFRQHRTVPL